MPQNLSLASRVLYNYIYITQKTASMSWVRSGVFVLSLGMPRSFQPRWTALTTFNNFRMADVPSREGGQHPEEQKCLVSVTL